MVAFANMSAAAKEDFAVSLAMLACHDAGVAISAENLKAICEASNNTVAPYWFGLFAKHCGKDVDSMLMKPGSGGGGGGGGGGGAAPAAAGGKKEEKKEEKKEVRCGWGGGAVRAVLR